MSARRAGMSVLAGDLFGDLDLQACCPSVRVSNYPQGLIDVLAAAPPGPWMYTGALENHPQLIERMESLRPLWGNTADCLRRVRDPATVFQALGRHGLAAPRVAEHADDLPTDGSWLVKRRRSAGGNGVAPWRGGASAGPRRLFPAAHRRPALRGGLCGFGRPCGFSGGDSAITGRQLGRPRMIFATRAASARCRCEPALLEAFQSVGQALATEFPLSGLFGVDAVRSRSDRLACRSQSTLHRVGRDSRTRQPPVAARLPRAGMCRPGAAGNAG